MGLLQLFLTYINQKQLLKTTDRLLLAISGGLDSVALGALCKQAGFEFGVAHCNFQLRGEESELDAMFVEQQAADWQVAFYTIRFDTKQYAQAKGISTQMAARELRYTWFEEIRREHGFDYLLTAHHQDDLLETVLLNLTRGTGLAGLHGILPKNRALVRPLLFATRPEIAQFLTENNLTWREDASNQTVDYQRNRLRHEVVPVLKNMNLQVSAGVAELAQRVGAAERLLAEYLRQNEGQIITKRGEQTHISYVALATLSEPIERLSFWLKDFGFSYQQVNTIWEGRLGQAGKQFHSATHTLRVDRGNFIISLSIPVSQGRIEVGAEATTVTFAGGTLLLSYFENYPDLFFENDPQVALFDAKLLTFPLTLRPWHAGDWLCPLGMNGKRKKVSNLLIDQKVSLTDKATVYVLESAGKIAWVVGIRLDERFKVRERTEKILRLVAVVDKN
jgi:tRNA(Ile)-lysidine synthase